MCEATSIGLLDFKWSFLSGLWSVSGLCFLITMLLSMEPSLLSSDGIFIHASLIHALLKQLQLTCLRVPSIYVVAPSSAPNGAFGHRRSISMMSHSHHCSYGPIHNRNVSNVQSPSVAPYAPPHNQDDGYGGAPSSDTVHDVQVPAVMVARKMLRDDMAALTARLQTEAEELQRRICFEEKRLIEERSAFFAKRDRITGRISRHISVQESLDVAFVKILAAAEAAHTADQAAGPSGVEAATPAAPLQGASSSTSGCQMVQRFIEGKADGSEPEADDMQENQDIASRCQRQMVQSQSLLDLLRQNEDIARQTMFWSTALQESIARALRESQLRESQGEAAKTIARQDDSLLKLLHENVETALQMTHLSRGLWDSLKPHVRSNERRRRDTGSNVESL